nr:uncharacterized protein LOC113814588 [Penaeus vannamei]
MHFAADYFFIDLYNPTFNSSSFPPRRPAHGITITRVSVPTPLAVGEGGVLECEWTYDGDHVYTLKWYQGIREFYRWTPQETPPPSLPDGRPGSASTCGSPRAAASGSATNLVILYLYLWRRVKKLRVISRPLLTGTTEPQVTSDPETQLETAWLGLTFSLRPGQVERGQVRIKCVASYPKLYWKSSEVVLQGWRGGPRRRQRV